jgi:hypothetical protein
MEGNTGEDTKQKMEFVWCRLWLVCCCCCCCSNDFSNYRLQDLPVPQLLMVGSPVELEQKLAFTSALGKVIQHQKQTIQ